jgi:hypothetical protein
MGALVTPILLWLIAATAALPLPKPAVVPCAADARGQALKLLRFHVDGDDRAAIDPASVRVVGTVASLVGKSRFDVVEVSGYVYKGSYRMRLIYARLDGRCVLMGQEIFERSDL